MENRQSSVGARYQHQTVAVYNKITLIVALVTGLMVVQVTCKPVESEQRLLLGELTPSPVGPLSLDDVRGSEEETTRPDDSIDNEQDKVSLRRRIIRLLLRLAIMKQVGGSSLDGETGVTGPTTVANGNGFTTDEELAEICEALCAVNLCPPGCPDNYKPPWG